MVLRPALVLAFVMLSSCQNKADPPAGGSAAPTVARPATETDHISVLARHRPIAGKEDLDSDPVVVRFERFAVTTAHFDPQHLEGGVASIELDVASLKTGSEERDKDLVSPDFFDVGKFATVTIDVANVKAQGATYRADATVACHGITKTYSITFAVVAATADSVRIKGEHAFSRLDFPIGVDPAKDPTERIDTPLTIQFELTLQNR